MAYIRVPMTVDVDELIDQARDRLAERFPGYVPQEGHLDWAVVEEMARMAAETADVAAQVPDEIFSVFGRELVKIGQIEGARAAGTARFTMIDDSGYNIPAGTVVLWRVSGDEHVAFSTTATLTIMPGNLSGDVDVTADDPGEHANELGPGPAELFEHFATVATVELVDSTAGGVNPETDEAYRARLSDELQLSAPRPILPDDFAVLARRTSGVHRALAIDGYNPADGTSGNARTVTLVPVDPDGQPVPAAVRDDLVADMQARREANFVVHTTEPTYTAVHIDFTVRRHTDALPDTVLGDTVAAVEEWISPANWGGGDQSPPVWADKPTVRYLELAAVLSAVSGVRFVEDLTINNGTADVALPGVAPLPARLDDPTDPSTVTGAVRP